MHSDAVRIRVRVLVRTAALAVAVAATLNGQIGDSIGGGRATLRGEVLTDSDASDALSVELFSVDDRAPVGRSATSANGGFEFDRLRPGDYQLRITDRFGNLLKETLVRVMGLGDYIRIRLPGLKRERPASESVSLSRLQHKVPKQARKEFEKADRAVRKGDSDEAIAHLKKALEIDPAYMEAYNNLGSRYMRAGRTAEAAEQFEKALHLDPGASRVAANLARARLILGQYGAAETAARLAMKLDPTAERSRYLLGVSLAAQEKDDEALPLLRQAASEVPHARLACAQILARKGDRTSAAAELQQYIDSPEAERREEARAWLARLQ